MRNKANRNDWIDSPAAAIVLITFFVTYKTRLPCQAIIFDCISS